MVYFRDVVKEMTPYAPAERASAEAVRRQTRAVVDTSLLKELLDAVNEEVLVLNRERQIVFCNREFSDALGLADRAAVLGMRPGEALHCVHAAEEHAGCGTSKFCQTCGAVDAILCSQRSGETAVRECRIQQRPHNEALDLKVKASPMALGGETLTVVAIQDISHEKRRRALEQIFFHDILNTAMSIRMNAELMDGAPPGEFAGLQASVVHGVARLVKEIQAQRALMSAEAGELPLTLVPLDALALLGETREAYEPHEIARGRRLVIDPASKSVVFRSDRATVLRVLENLAKNALEAVSADEVVTLGCAPEDGGVMFLVHNPGVIPENVRLRMFQRSFSTKGPGRGLGTYSVKLLTEKFLGGKAAFSTSEGEGTTFRVWIPADVPPGPSGSLGSDPQGRG